MRWFGLIGVVLLATPALAGVVTKDTTGAYVCKNSAGKVLDTYLPAGARPDASWRARCEAASGTVVAPPKAPATKAPTAPERTPG